MSKLSDKLDQVEARLQTLIEGRFTRLFTSIEYRGELISNLESAMKSGIKIQTNGSSLAPDLYILLVHPDFALRIEGDSDLLDELAAVIDEAGSSAGLTFHQQPSVTLSPNSDITGESIVVLARISQEVLGKTVEQSNQPQDGKNNMPRNAFLIVNGAEIFPLDTTLVNIGRRSTNDLIINDPRVSRAHAQLRAIRGNYVLSDLGSRGGTWVNDQPVTQKILYPRDVISLAGVPLVYGQDDFSLGPTQQIETRPTAPGNDSLTKDTIL
jgi:hypothetical protein